MRPIRFKQSTCELLLLGFCLALFACFATTDLALPGPQDDEVVHACLALDMMHPQYPYSQDYRLHLGNHPFPFGVIRHTGAFKAYLLWPLFALLGPSVELLRLFTVFLGLITLLFFYLFAKEVAGPWAAFWAAFLLSLDSAFIFCSKLDNGPVIELLMWMMIGLWSFAKWLQTRKRIYPLLFIVSGVFGMYSHITFVWSFSAFFFACFLFYEEEFLKFFKRPIVYFVVSGLCVVLTIFLYWLVGDFRQLLRSPPWLFGIFSMFERLSTQGGVVPEVLSGGPVRGLLPRREVTPPTDIFLLISLLFLLLRWKTQSREVRFLVVLSGVILLEVFVTPGEFVHSAHRLLPFYILLILLSGVALVQNAKILRNFKVRSSVSAFFSLALLLLASCSVLGQLTFTQDVIQRIRRTGGKGHWSDGIYTVAEVLQRERWEETIVLDWGHPSLVLLGKGTIPLGTSPWVVYTVDQTSKLQMLSQMLREASPRVLFLLNPVWKYRGGVTPQEFYETAERVGKNVTLEHFFRDREQTPIYAAFTVHP